MDSKLNLQEMKNKLMRERVMVESPVRVKEEKKQIVKKEKVTKPKVKKEEELNTDISGKRTWDDLKNKASRKGAFDEQEKNTLLNALCEYIQINGLVIEDVIEKVSVKQKKEDKSIWTKIAEHLPDRSVQSVHNFFHRILNPNNYKGTWTEDEIEKLLYYVKDIGEKWKDIGEYIGRTATNCKDKYKELGGKNFDKRIKSFDIITALKFFKYMQELTSAPLLRLRYKFVKNLSDPYQIKEGILCLSTEFKDDKSELIIQNILKLVLDFDELADLVRSNKEIQFTSLSERIQSKSFDDCKNFWNKFVNEFALTRKAQAKSDLKMIKL